MADKPLPSPDLATAPYWAAAREGRLVVQECRACERLIFPPKPRCPRCMAAPAWTRVSGKGVIHSYSVAHQSLVAGLPAPYVVAAVALAEDPRCKITANIVEASIAEVAIGAEVEVVFEQRSADISLPQFRLRAKGPEAAR